MKTKYNIISSIKKQALLILTAVILSCSSSFAGENPALKINFDVAIETEMKIEKWMTNLKSWTKTTATAIDLNVIEEEMEIEEWMLNADMNNWEYEAPESDIEIETWMLDATDENWNTETNEEEIELENWMTDLSNWR